MQATRIAASSRCCTTAHLVRSCRSSRTLRSPLHVSATSNFETPEIDTEALKAKATEVATTIKQKWAETDDKPAIVSIGVASFIAIVSLNAIADAINKIPLVSNMLELVGIVATTWFVYRYLVFGPDREELKSNISAFVEKVKGS